LISKGYSRRLRKSVRVLVLAVVLVLLSPSLAGARGGADVRAIRALLHRQMALAKDGNFRTLYQTTTTARFRAGCDYDRFVRIHRRLQLRLGPAAQVDRIQVRFTSARRAVVAYRYLKNRRPFLWVRFRAGDLYVKIGRRWYDEHDRTGC
jgi:hypothetical protein